VHALGSRQRSFALNSTADECRAVLLLSKRTVACHAYFFHEGGAAAVNVRWTRLRSLLMLLTFTGVGVDNIYSMLADTYTQSWEKTDVNVAASTFARE
jgi:hypothetical protein